jgi:hypothetical protein
MVMDSMRTVHSAAMGWDEAANGQGYATMALLQFK